MCQRRRHVQRVPNVVSTPSVWLILCFLKATFVDARLVLGKTRKEYAQVNLLGISVCLITLRQGKGGAVASWLVRSTADRALRVGHLAGDIVLCSR